MLCALDVQYEAHGARAAALIFARWDAVESLSEHVIDYGEAAPYVPGELWRRELPPVMSLLATLPTRPQLIVVDGQVWLEEGKHGFGAHLHEALDGAIPVVGVAKTSYRGAHGVIEVRRGLSERPLFVSAIGIDSRDVAEAVRTMAGEFRLPALLKRTDQLARGLVPPMSKARAPTST